VRLGAMLHSGGQLITQEEVVSIRKGASPRDRHGVGRCRHHPRTGGDSRPNSAEPAPAFTAQQPPRPRRNSFVGTHGGQRISAVTGERPVRTYDPGDQTGSSARHCRPRPHVHARAPRKSDLS
jgi:hypothetical protein